MKKKYNSGFSLVELVIVIAIMSALTAVIAVAVLRYRLKANEAVNKANIKAAKDAVLYYEAEDAGGRTSNYYAFSISDGTIVTDSTNTYDAFSSNDVDLSHRVYEIIYLYHDENGIRTWPSDNEDIASGTIETAASEESSSEHTRPSAIDNGNGTYSVKKGDYLTINGKTYQYLGKGSDNAAGPETRKGKKYWKVIDE